MKPIVISPSVAPINFDYYSGVEDLPILIVDDSHGKIKRDAPPDRFQNVTFFDREAVRRYIPRGTEWLFPEYNPSCKNFGLFYAWKEGYDTIILLDDDCDTSVNPNFLDQVPIHKEVIADTVSCPHGWWNPMIQLDRPEFWSRGFPYEFRYIIPAVSGISKTVTPMFNEGLWWGTPDINGADKIGHEPEAWEATGYPVTPQYTVMHSGQLVPISIMNVQLAGELIPAFYQPPDFDIAPGWKIRRHDDVWSGIVLQLLMDKLDHAFTVGEPLIFHRKRGDLIKEIKSETCTNLFQPYLVRLLKEAIAYVPADNYANMICSLATESRRIMINHHSRIPGRFYTVMANYLNQIEGWAKLCASHTVGV